MEFENYGFSIYLPVVVESLFGHHACYFCHKYRTDTMGYLLPLGYKIKMAICYFTLQALTWIEKSDRYCWNNFSQSSFLPKIYAGLYIKYQSVASMGITTPRSDTQKSGASNHNNRQLKLPIQSL